MRFKICSQVIDQSKLAQLHENDVVISNMKAKVTIGQFFKGCKQFIIRDNVLCFVSQDVIRPYIPHALQESYVEYFHAHPLFGHLGFHKCLALLRQRYYWPHLRSTVHNVLRACQKCLTRKEPARQPQGLLEPIKVERPFELIAWDVVGPLPESKSGNRYIIVVTDYLTKWCEAKAVVAEVSAKTVAKFLLEDIVTRHGYPEAILLDQGRNFVSKVKTVMSTSLGIK